MSLKVLRKQLYVNPIDSSHISSKSWIIPFIFVWIFCSNWKFDCSELRWNLKYDNFGADWIILCTSSIVNDPNVKFIKSGKEIFSGNRIGSSGSSKIVNDFKWDIDIDEYKFV